MRFRTRPLLLVTLLFAAALSTAYAAAPAAAADPQALAPRVDALFAPFAQVTGFTTGLGRARGLGFTKGAGG
jgi:hypothetical protein